MITIITKRKTLYLSAHLSRACCYGSRRNYFFVSLLFCQSFFPPPPLQVFAQCISDTNNRRLVPHRDRLQSFFPSKFGFVANFLFSSLLFVVAARKGCAQDLLFCFNTQRTAVKCNENTIRSSEISLFHFATATAAVKNSIIGQHSDFAFWSAYDSSFVHNSHLILINYHFFFLFFGRK